MTQTVPDISPLMPMHQDPLLVVPLWVRQNCRHFADDIFKCNFFHGNDCVLIKLPLKFVPKGSNDNTPVFVHITAWQLAPKRRQTIISTNDGIVYWRIYASFGLSVIIHCNETHWLQHNGTITRRFYTIILWIFSLRIISKHHNHSQRILHVFRCISPTHRQE